MKHILTLILLIMPWQSMLAMPGGQSPAYILIAHPAMNDGSFKQSVVLVMQHSGQNAVGVILNKPMPLLLSNFFPDQPAADSHKEPVFFGGPISEDAYTYMVQAKTKPGRVLPVIDDLWLGVDSILLKQVLEKEISTDAMRVFKGYAGWAPGQLQAEIEHGMWYIIPASAEILMTPNPESLWLDLIAGIEGSSI